MQAAGNYFLEGVKGMVGLFVKPYQPPPTRLTIQQAYHGLDHSYSLDSPIILGPNMVWSLGCDQFTAYHLINTQHDPTAHAGAIGSTYEISRSYQILPPIIPTQNYTCIDSTCAITFNAPLPLYPTLKFNSAGNPFQAIDTESIPPSEFNATVISFPTHRPCQLKLRQIILAIHLTHKLNQTCKRTEQKYNLLVSPTLMDAIYILA
ncbi:hypothetical protein DSO57_1037064 [Entomophthora muscae]|uniref:Uncharacterized protein n=1 Tax=Entomophthora muscae TaxID=34485 RepID=A0ACC2TYJ1_9FUNG|nr:hypothetical protein DSO57_1037064 [Entomophthora muscae]